jgi:hypothetical protein
LNNSDRNLENQSKVFDHSKDFRGTFTLILQIFVGSVLLIKAVDGILPLFPLEYYTDEAQNLMMSMESTPLMSGLIVGVHVLLGTFLIFNFFVPFTLMLSAPLVGFAFAFELLYGSYALPQVLTTLAVVSLVGLLFYHSEFFKSFFRAQMTYDVMAPESARAELLLLEEVREKAPRKYERIVAMDVVKESIV